MAEILSLAGRPALSPFRVAKLLAGLSQAHSAHRVASLTATYWHFVELARPLAATERDTLERILTYGPAPHEAGDRGGAELLVVPRPGTISPWSSKATDIAHNCGLDAVARIERGVLFRVHPRDDALLASADRDALLPLIHDRMTEAVFAEIGDAARLFAHFPPRPLATIALLGEGRAALERANAATRPGAGARRDRLPRRELPPLGRDPTDVELMMFAQANSEHCRHKIFNADWIVDGVPQEKSLFGDDPRDAQGAPRRHRRRVLRQRGRDGRRDRCSASTRARIIATARAAELTHTLMKVETHNHPTAIAPFPGAATGSGGEIRDEGATGTGGKPKAGLTGFTVSNLRIPGLTHAWEQDYGKPERIASALSIMLEGPIGGASFNNEFGRPNLAGYFRTFEQEVAGEVRGYHKPIMIAGGVGNLNADARVQASVAGWYAADPARRPGHADRHGRRRGVVDGAPA